jgi:hypothetical protein
MMLGASRPTSSRELGAVGHDGSIFNARWPGWDERLTMEGSVEIAVQVGLGTAR